MMATMDLPFAAATSVGRLLGAVPGAALGALSLVTALARGSKPLHPVGVVGEGVLTISGGGPPSGVPLLDRADEHAVLVRWSRGIGRDAGESDIEGLAVRLTERAEQTDVLFASTGDSAIGRYLLDMRAWGEHGTVTTLIPVRTAAGPLLLRLSPRGAGSATTPPTRYVLSWSRTTGPWVECGVLAISWGEGDSGVRFDAVLHPLPGTRQYAVVAALREPAYWAGRRQSPDPRAP